MAEQQPQGVKSTVSGWIKALLTSVVGLVSGAILMYLTPLVNNVIKPAKPIANFAVQTTGLTVQFNNRSTGGTQGWWDFGDGTALEPFDPKAETIKHDYVKPGTYQVKLALQNLLGEESERVAPVTLDAMNSTAPVIDHFELKPFSPGEQVPAVYALHSKVKNAQYCILCCGDDRPIEVIEAGNQDRYVMFKEMGAYTVRLAAVNGKQLVEKSHTVFVNPSEGLAPMAKLQVTYEAVKVERFTRDWRIACDWPAGTKENVVPIRKERPAYSGALITSAELVNKVERNTPVRNVKVEIAPDKSKIILTGELVKPSGLLASRTPPNWLAEVKVTMERRSPPMTVNRGDIMLAVNLGGTTMLPLQPMEEGWDVVRKSVNVELWDGSRKVWGSGHPVTKAKVTLKNQPYLVTTIPQNDGVLLKVEGQTLSAIPRLDVPPTPVGPLIRPASFETNPLIKLRPKK